MRLKYSKFTHNQANKLLEQFVAGTPARTAALLVGVNRNLVNGFYHRLRVIIHDKFLEEMEELAGEVEVDESYFGGVRKGKRGRGAAGKVAVFGILKRGGKVFTLPVPDTRSDTLIPIIAFKVQPDSIVYTDCYKSYDVLDITDFHHMRINPQNCSQTSIITSMASKTSGTRQSVICANLMVFLPSILSYSSKCANGDLTTVTHQTSYHN